MILIVIVWSLMKTLLPFKLNIALAARTSPIIFISDATGALIYFITIKSILG